MYIRQPEYFLTIARELSIVKAAKLLYVSEPYLSQYISKLEKENNAIFLDRSVYPFILTEAGKLLCQYIEKMQGLEKEMDANLLLCQGTQSNVLNIGFSAGRGPTLLPPFMKALREKFPNTNVVLHERPSDKLTELLREGKCDVIILHTQEMLPDLVYETLVNEQIVLCAPKNHPLLLDYDDSHPFDLTMLKNEAFILPRPNQSLAKVIYKLFSRYGLHPRNTVVTTSSSTTMKLVSEGFGFAFWTGTDALSNHLAEDIRIIPLISNPPITFPLTAVYRTTASLKPESRMFIDMAAEYYSRII